MEVEGYKKHDADAPDWEVEVCLSKNVRDYLREEGTSGKRNERNVRKAKITLTQLKRFGEGRVRESAQFKRQGKFPSGRRIGGEQVVSEIKSDQVRIYGGSITARGVTTFFFVEAVTKQTNKADQKLLKRVAKALGAIHDELERK